MAFYGSMFTSETSWDRRTSKGHARHIACPQRLKYIHDVKDGYIPYVEDSDYFHRNILPKKNRFGLYNTADAWRQELMELAQQVQVSLLPLDESRLNQRRSKRIGSSIITSHSDDNDEEYISKRLLNRRSTPRYRHCYTPKPRIMIDKNEPRLSTSNSNKNQDAGIWLLPILCYILQVDNIVDAQEWLVNANPTEKRLAMELISRTMYDMQNHENDFLSDISTSGQSSNFNNLYWPYKFWQHQQQSKDNNDTCERATSPVRFVTPAKRLSVSSISNRSDKSFTNSRLSTSMTTIPDDNNDRQSRRSYRVVTSRDSSNSKTSVGKIPLI